MASHDTNFDFTFKEYSFGILFYSFLTVNAQGKGKEGDLLERVNAFNINAIVSRCFFDMDDSLVFITYIPNTYEKTTFGGLIEQFNRDHQLIRVENINLIEYLQ